MYMNMENFLLVSFKMLLPNHFKECCVRISKRHAFFLKICIIMCNERPVRFFGSIKQITHRSTGQRVTCEEQLLEEQNIIP